MHLLVNEMAREIRIITIETTTPPTIDGSLQNMRIRTWHSSDGYLEVYRYESGANHLRFRRGATKWGGLRVIDNAQEIDHIPWSKQLGCNVCTLTL